MNQEPNYSPVLQAEITKFFEFVPPARLSRNLRKLVLTYLSLQKDAHNMDMEELLLDIQLLFDLLDVAGEELAGNNKA